MVQLFGSKVHFNFVNINLVDSTTNAEASKGYVSYRVKPLANLPLGTTIENTASIYFDFNTPIVTNTVSNVICNPIIPTIISESICAGETYSFNGATISVAGNYSATLNAISGCDSVVNLSLAVLNPAASTLLENICEGEIFNFNGMNLSTEGIYSDTMNAMNGCDSIITLNLAVDTVNTGIALSVGGGAAASLADSATYQWLDCNNNFSPITGATNQSYTTSSSESVAVVVEQNGCTDTSNCVFLSGISNLDLITEFSVFPNPTDENITISFSQPCNNCNIEISNTIGQIVYEEQTNSQLSIINCQLLPVGIYFIALRSDKFNAVKKLIIQ